MRSGERPGWRKVRVCLSRVDEVDVVIPRENVVLALIPNDQEVGVEPHQWYRIMVPEAWANGDGIEVVLKRIPKGSR